MTPAATPPIISLPAKPISRPRQTTASPSIAFRRLIQWSTLCGPTTVACASGSSEDAVKETSFGSGTYTSLTPSTVPPAAYGPNTYQYSYFYLAAVDVTVPTLNGTVTAKVRRVFEKRFDNPWTYAMFYVDDLELQPADTLIINGPVSTPMELFILARTISPPPIASVTVAITSMVMLRSMVSMPARLPYPTSRPIYPRLKSRLFFHLDGTSTSMPRTAARTTTATTNLLSGPAAGADPLSAALLQSSWLPRLNR